MVNENVLLNHIIELSFLMGNEVYGVSYIYLNMRAVSEYGESRKLATSAIQHNINSLISTKSKILNTMNIDLLNVQKRDLHDVWKIVLLFTQTFYHIAQLIQTVFVSLASVLMCLKLNLISESDTTLNNVTKCITIDYNLFYLKSIFIFSGNNKIYKTKIKNKVTNYNYDNYIEDQKYRPNNGTHLLPFQTICNDVNISELHTLTSKKVFKSNKTCVVSLLVQQSSGFLIVDIGINKMKFALL
ncbi:hypothetical protein AGLY_012302 [Aphis glycines]|uniref:Uncharacterized protein n=1 Tax=Aphis glycines TaxID=307491 RepID=A0A6G0T9N6_APHGL|nr:hypothetical protein AGLY_012302 [Aphis glycines]